MSRSIPSSFWLSEDRPYGQYMVDSGSATIGTKGGNHAPLHTVRLTFPCSRDCGGLRAIRLGSWDQYEIGGVCSGSVLV
jgi:hypothetical protein